MFQIHFYETSDHQTWKNGGSWLGATKQVPIA